MVSNTIWSCEILLYNEKLTVGCPIGGLNQEEFSFEINYFVTADPSVEHLHNQLLAGIYGNVCRDAPEPGVAPWVSANDKPTIVSKPVSGDAAEQRLKTEVMQLPGKDRRRLKHIPEVLTSLLNRLISKGADFLRVIAGST